MPRQDSENTAPIKTTANTKETRRMTKASIQRSTNQLGMAIYSRNATERVGPGEVFVDVGGEGGNGRDLLAANLRTPNAEERFVLEACMDENGAGATGMFVTNQEFPSAVSYF
jgi:hypothetical protein